MINDSDSLGLRPNSRWNSEVPLESFQSDDNLLQTYRCHTMISKMKCCDYLQAELSAWVSSPVLEWSLQNLPTSLPQLLGGLHLILPQCSCYPLLTDVFPSSFSTSAFPLRLFAPYLHKIYRWVQDPWLSYPNIPHCNLDWPEWGNQFP